MTRAKRVVVRSKRFKCQETTMRIWSRNVGSLLLIGALLLSSGCKKEVASEGTADAQISAAENGVANDAAKAAIVGQWKIDGESSVDLEGLDEAEADFVRAMAQTVRAGVEFGADGSLTMFARVADSPVQREEGTWALVETGMQNFIVEMRTEGSESADRVTFEPMADGTVTMKNGEATLILKKADLDAFLADAEEGEDTDETPDATDAQ